MIYAVCMSVQPDEVSQYCFNDCGKINIGGIEMYDLALWPCRTDNCPYAEKEESFGEAEFDWGKEEVIGRKLKPLQASPQQDSKEG